MRFFVAFHDAEVLEGARARSIAGHFPHLRLVSLVPDAPVESLPAHIRARVIVDPLPSLLDGGIHALLTADPPATAARFPQVAPSDILTWDELPGAYSSWVEEQYLPANALLSTFTPEGLTPLGFSQDRLVVELIGSCGAVFLERAAREMELECFHTIQNHPVASAPERAPTVRVVVPPLRYMHPATLDDFVAHPDHERLFDEARRHMLAYLDSVLCAAPDVPLFVLGFVEPHMNPAGIFFHTREKSNFKHFVRCLNDAVVEWCASQASAHFVDGDALAAAVGKLGVEESTQTYLSHRGPLDPEYDDCTDALWPFQPPQVERSYDIRSNAFSAAVLREVVQRQLILRGVGRVKAVIVDLDNTVWRGLASDGVVGPWAGRPQGIVEALKILKSRGVFLAIASKNDEAYIREHWDEITGSWSEVPLTIPLTLDDFDVVKIGFQPKSQSVREILAALNILPDGAVFVDDNPLEREEVQAAFPEIRVLGAEMNYVRRELIYSPFTQAPVKTAEDAVRSATVKKQAELQAALEAGASEDFLAALKLVCRVEEVVDRDSAAGQRAFQLINKTNQWNINGRRIEDAEFRSGRLFVADVRDAGNSYGIVGAALVHGEVVTHLVISCRVIGMGIDDAFVQQLVSRCGPLRLDYADSGKNRGTKAFIERHAPDADSLDLSAVAAPAHVGIEGPEEPLAPAA
jgi:FkbH-like protein